MAKAIREFCGKELLHKYVEKLRSEAEGERQGKVRIPFVSAPVTDSTDFDLLVKGNPWLTSEVQVYVASYVCVEKGGRGVCLHSPQQAGDWYKPHVFSLPQQKLVVKPDQLIKRRGKLGLVKVASHILCRTLIGGNT